MGKLKSHEVSSDLTIVTTWKRADEQRLEVEIISRDVS